ARSAAMPPRSRTPQAEPGPVGLRGAEPVEETAAGTGRPTPAGTASPSTASRSPTGGPAAPERLLDVGVGRLGHSRGDLPWTVLLDPGDNEFCLPRPRHDAPGNASAAAPVV